MDHLTNTIAQADPTRLAKAAQVLADNTITIKVAFRTADEIRAHVTNGDAITYSVVLTADRAFCGCPDATYHQGKPCSKTNPAILHSCYHASALALYGLRNQPTEAERCSADAESATETAEPTAPGRPKVVRLRKFREHAAA
jgi:hypothetical protein